MTEPNTLFTKEGFLFVKNKDKNYSLYFEIENNNIILEKIIDFHLVKLIYDLNPEIYEKVNLKIMNENEATINLLLKHLYEELGLPQRFTYVHIKKEISKDNITFESKTIKSERPEGMPNEAELMPIKNMIIKCDIITQHKIKFTCNIIFEDTMIIPSIVEKIVGFVSFKIFSRVKQFIEKVSV